MNLAARNPVAVRAAAVAAVTSVVHVAVVTGLVPAEVEDPIAAAVDSLGLLVLVLWARAGVTPNAKVITRVTTDGAVVTGDAAAIATGTPVDTGLYSVAGAPTVEPVVVNPDLVDQLDEDTRPLPEGTHVREVTELVHDDDTPDPAHD